MLRDRTYGHGFGRPLSRDSQTLHPTFTGAAETGDIDREGSAGSGVC